MQISYDIDLRKRNTFGMRVRAAALLEYDSCAELAGVLADCRFSSELPQPFMHIGGGSNLLFTRDFPGTILHSRIRFIEPLQAESPDRQLVRVGAGTLWDDFCAWAASEGLWGPENLSLIPGETGAAAVQNIGAYGREICELVDTVECLDTLEHRQVLLKAPDCGYGYRDSKFKREWKGRYVVTAVTFCLQRGYAAALDYGHIREAIEKKYGSKVAQYTPQQIRDVIIDIRRKKLPDPANVGNAGSFWRNPYVLPEQYAVVAQTAEREGLGPVPHFAMDNGLIKIPAAWLIEQCGWKGARKGNAGVWPDQPLVLVNATGTAAPEEIIALEEAVTNSVREKFGIILVPEVEHI